MGSRRSARQQFALVTGAALTLLFSAGPAAASVMRFLQVEELARSSTLIVRARVLQAEARWTEDRQGILTEVKVAVVGPIASTQGPPPAQGRILTLIQAGGEVDGVRLDWHGRPTFSPGEDLILFLQPYDPAVPTDERLIVVGGRQGRMRVLPSTASQAGTPLVVERDLFGILDAPHFSGVEATGPGNRRDLMPFDELARRVRQSGGAR